MPLGGATGGGPPVTDDAARCEVTLVTLQEDPRLSRTDYEVGNALQGSRWVRSGPIGQVEGRVLLEVLGCAGRLCQTGARSAREVLRNSKLQFAVAAEG